MFYKTRHLVALRDISHGDQLLGPGDEFFATEVDADYYLAKGKAAPAPKVIAEFVTAAASTAQPVASVVSSEPAAVELAPGISLISVSVSPQRASETGSSERSTEAVVGEGAPGAATDVGSVPHHVVAGPSTDIADAGTAPTVRRTRRAPAAPAADTNTGE